MIDLGPIDQALGHFANAIAINHKWTADAYADRLVIPMDGYAPKELAQNNHTTNHWGQRSSESGYWKGEAKKAAEAWIPVLPMFGGPVWVTIYSFVGFGRTTMDLLNEPACFKAHLDGFTLAGVWVDDSVVESLRVMHIKLSTREGRRLLPLDGVTVFAIEGSPELVTPIGQMKKLAMEAIGK